MAADLNTTPITSLTSLQAANIVLLGGLSAFVAGDDTEGEVEAKFRQFTLGALREHLASTGGAGWMISASAPSTPAGGDGWWDTTAHELKIYDAGNTRWVTIGPASLPPDYDVGSPLTETDNRLYSPAEVAEISGRVINDSVEQWARDGSTPIPAGKLGQAPAGPSGISQGEANTLIRAHANLPNVHHAPPFTAAQIRKLLEVAAIFHEGGWVNSTTAQVSTTVKIGSAPHTAGELTGLTYAASRTNPTPSSNAGYIGVRVPSSERADADAGKLRVVQLSQEDATPARLVELGSATFVAESSGNAYYSAPFAEFVGDETTRVQELDDFGIDGRYLHVSGELDAHDRRVLNSFEEAVWENSTATLSGPSTLAFNPSVTATAFTATKTVPPQTQAFHMAVAIPIGRKDDHARFRIAALPTGEDEHYGDLGRHITDTAMSAIYEVRFSASTAPQTMRVQELDEHHIDTDNIHINFEELHNTPLTLVGQNGKLLIVNAAGDAIAFAELMPGSNAVRINGLTIDVDQTAFDILQIGAAQNSVTQTFLVNATSNRPSRVVLPGGAFNIEENNIIIVEWEINGRRQSRPVHSAVLRHNATIGAKTGTEASGDQYYPITIGWDSSGNRQELRLYRSADNELILGGALVTPTNGYTRITDSAPHTAFVAEIRLYELGGNAGAANRQQQIVSLAPKFWTGYLETAANVTPNLPIGFDGAHWTGVDAWSRDPLPGATPAGRIRWFGSAEVAHNPMATFDWTVVTKNVRPINDIRFATVEDPRNDSQIQSTPPANGGYWQPYDASTGWGRHWFPLGVDPLWRYLDAADWRPDAIGSTANIDFPEQDAANLDGISLIVNVYNSGGHDVFYRIPFTLEPLPNVQAAAAGTVTQTELNGFEVHWEHRVRSADIFFSDLNLPGGANQANYHLVAFNGQLQHRTSPGGTRFNRIALKAPGVWRATRDIRWRVELRVRTK